MKNILYITCIVSLFTSCRSEKLNFVLEKPPVISGNDYDPACGADAYRSRGDNPHSCYYGHPNFYTLTTNEALTLLSHFKTMQQTTEWSCGNTCALMVLQHFGKAATWNEYSLAEMMHSMTDSDIPGSLPGSAKKYADYGTRLEELYRFFSGQKGLKVVGTSYRAAYTENELVKPSDTYPVCDCGNLYPTFPSPASFASWLKEHLSQGHPVIAEWSDWDGHWVVIIGIDNNHTPDFTGDDILIFADPYDTSDHWQDGYSIAPLERFFYSWKDRAIAPKPYQLQPYLVIAEE